MRVKRILFLLLFFIFGFSFSQAQIITTIAGNGVYGYSGDGGQATSAEFELGGARVCDSENVYVADELNDRVRKIEINGIINIVAGGGSVDPGDGGPATAAYILYPTEVITDAEHNFYFGNRYEGVRKVDTNGILSTYAGGGTSTADTSIPATAISIQQPVGLAFDTGGNLYVADQYNSKIHRIDKFTGLIRTIAGNGASGGTGDGGPATAAELDYPGDIVFDKFNNLYLTDGGDERIRVINATTQIITTFAGTGWGGYSGDGGPATAAELNGPGGIAIDDSGNIYIADNGNNRIRKVNTSGIITTIIGNGFESGGVGGFSGDGGPASAAELFGPGEISFDKKGNLFITDGYNSRIRKVTNTLDVSTSITSVSCPGGSNGTATAIAYESPSEAPYTYSWSPVGGMDTTITGLSVGTYTITVWDKNDSSYSTTVTVTQLPVVSVSASLINLSCASGSNGIVFATVSGGTMPYTYLWNDARSQTTDTASGLSTGTYTVTVNDSCGSSATAAVAIPLPDTLEVSINFGGVSCSGGGEGSAIALVSGGRSPYTYSWSDASSQTTDTATGLSAGIYSVVVTDACGSTVSSSIIITQPSALIISTSSVNLHCNGISTGSASVNASGGSQPYTYEWEWETNGIQRASTATISALSAGTYTIYVEDSNRCFAGDIVIITQPTAIIVNTTIISTINNCNGGNNGSLYLTATEGFLPYTYLWSDPNNQTTDTAIGLSAGNYTITVTDSTGCTGWASNTFTLQNSVNDSLTVISNVPCYGGNNGSSTVFISSGGNVVRNYSFEPAVQHFIVPPGINTISINIGGAQGSSGDSGLDGNGANFTGICPVTPGHILSVVVGQKSLGHGGGASWVYDSNIVLYGPAGDIGLLAVAAGGGEAGSEGAGIRLTTAVGGLGGTNLITNAPTVCSYYGGAGGTSANGGGGDIGGGGAGWLSNGQNGTRPDSGGMDETNHFFAVNGGGFAGGGSGGQHVMGGTRQYCGGGGGGYNGGGAGVGGGGGGSYFINTSPIVTANDTGNGFVTISYSYGTFPPYTYLWSNGETTDTATGLSAGIYTVTVEDSLGCSAVWSVTITQPSSALTLTADSSADFGTCNGSAWAIVNGVTNPYTYSWNPSGLITDTITNQCAADYCCTVTDANGCMESVCVNIPVSTGESEVKGESEKVKVYPNPNTGIFTVALSHPELVSGSQPKLKIYNVLGQQIYFATPQTLRDDNLIDLSSQPDGVYFYRVIAESGTLVGEGKIVIER